MSDAELTPETLAYLRWQEENPGVWGDQDENGVDLARLRENLKLPPAERIRHMDLRRGFPVLRALRDAGVYFVLIGNVAMYYHGVLEPSGIADVVYTVECRNAERLAAFLKASMARLIDRAAADRVILSPALLRRARYLHLTMDSGGLNVMREVPGLDSFEGLWERAVPMDLGGFVVRVASLDDLIAMKRAANCPKDQLHLKELLAFKRLMAEETA